MTIFSPELFLIVRAVLPSFTIALLGFILGKLDTNRELNQKTISNVIYYFFTPCLVFSSLHRRSFDLQEFAVIGGAAVLLIAAMIPLAFYVKRRVKVAENGYCLPIIFMNTGNISLAIALLLFGNDGLSKSILFHTVNIMLLYSFGVFLVSGRTDMRQFLKIPALYATVLGIIVSTTTFSAPVVATQAFNILNRGIDMIALGTIPLLIVNLGYSISETKITNTLKVGIPGASMRIIVGPLLAFGLVFSFRALGWIPVDPSMDPLVALGHRTTEGIIILNAAMPGPIMAYLLNVKFESCPEKAAAMLSIGTLAGIITIPIVLNFVTLLIR
ncbi:MAG: AEC family transporter [Desulfuromonadaceae bacterium]|nr:AEC family transporter [Desulfuromonas sp.]MDY0185424.1 AEC family transporter [Desulfuromonadaceae bacterium]